MESKTENEAGEGGKSEKGESALAHPRGEQLDTIHKRKIDERDIRTKDRSRNKDNDCRIAQLSFRRPRRLFELGHRLFIEETDACEWIFHEKLKMAGEEGLEPPTYGFGDRCSTN